MVAACMFLIFHVVIYCDKKKRRIIPKQTIYRCYIGTLEPIYLTVQTENTCKHVMCNIRCTSREKRENASPQKPQSSAEAQGDTHVQTHT